jgi:ankyrin repeat protein
LEVVQLLLSHANDAGTSDTVVVRPSYFEDSDNERRDIVGLNQPHNNGWTPLFWAIIKHQYQAAEQLLTAGSKVNMQDEAKWTPIEWAAFRADKDFVDLILRFTPSTQPSDHAASWEPLFHHPESFSPLFLAAAVGDRQSIDAMFNFGFKSPRPTVIPLKMFFGVSAKVDRRSQCYRRGRGSISLPSFLSTDDFSVKLLESAILVDQRAVVKLLVELGASLGVVKSEVKQRNPLHIASCYGHYEICEYLLLKGASLSLLDADGLTAMDLAIMAGHPQYIRLFLNLAPSPSALIERNVSLTTFLFDLKDSGPGKLMIRAPTHRTKACCDPKLPKSTLPMLETRVSGNYSTHFDDQSASTSQEIFEFGDVIDILQTLFGSGCDSEAIDEFYGYDIGTDEQDTALHHAWSIMNPDLISFLSPTAQTSNVKMAKARRHYTKLVLTMTLLKRQYKGS